MNALQRVLLALTVTVVIGFCFSAGLWLLSHTTYPFARTVGGATLICVALGLCVGVIWVSESKAEATSE